MRPRVSTPSMIKAIKLLLKEKDFTYSDLANHLGLSLPAVKRAMNQADVSLDRVLKICELLNVDLLELIEVASDPESNAHRFTQAQENFFAQNPHYLAYFFEVHHNHLQPLEIEKKHKISTRSSLKYLTKLESFGLLRREKDKRIHSCVAPSIHWDDHGPIGRVFSHSMLKEMSERVMKKIKNGESTNLFLNGWHLQPRELEAFLKEITEMQNRYRQISVFNRRQRSKSQLGFFSFAAMVDKRDAMIFETVKEL